MNIQLLLEFIAIAIGGAIGALSRFLLSSWVQGRTETEYFPWGILSVNILGCFIVGILFGFLVERFQVGPIIRSGIFIGVLGGFTTFSSFSMDCLTLIYAGAYGIATAYILASVGGGVLATMVGLTLARFLL